MVCHVWTGPGGLCGCSGLIWDQPSRGELLHRTDKPQFSWRAKLTTHICISTSPLSAWPKSPWHISFMKDVPGRCDALGQYEECKGVVCLGWSGGVKGQLSWCWVYMPTHFKHRLCCVWHVQSKKGECVSGENLYATEIKCAYLHLQFHAALSVQKPLPSLYFLPIFWLVFDWYNSDVHRVSRWSFSNLLCECRH